MYLLVSFRCTDRLSHEVFMVSLAVEASPMRKNEKGKSNYNIK